MIGFDMEPNTAAISAAVGGVHAHISKRGAMALPVNAFFNAIENEEYARLTALFVERTTFRERREFFEAGGTEFMTRYCEETGWALGCFHTILECIATDTDESRKCWYEYLNSVPSTPSSQGYRPFMWHLVHYMDLRYEGTGEYINAASLFKLLDADVDDMIARSIRLYRHRPIDTAKSDYHELIASRLLAGSGRLTKGAQRD